MATLGRIIAFILQFLGLGGLPDDVNSWRSFILNHLVPWGSGMLSFVGSLVYGATWWQAGILAGLFVPGVYLALFLVRAGARRWTHSLGEAPSIQGQEAPKVKPGSVERGPDQRRPRRGIVLEGRAQHEDEGSDFYDTLDEGIHASDDARTATKGTTFGKRQKHDETDELDPEERG